nr:zinc ABC transporter substrate-binding protein [Oceanobacillus limi]
MKLNKKYLAALFGIMIIPFILGACNNTSSSNQEDSVTDDPLKIYTTLYPLEDFVNKIGGDYVEVESIIPPGSDSHTYEPTSKEMVEIAKADAFIFNGLGMETYAEKISSALEDEDVMIVEATVDIETIEHHHEHGHEEDEAHDHVDESESSDEDHDHNHESESESNDEEHDHNHEDESESSNEDHEEESQDEHHEHEHGDLDPHIWLDPHRAVKLAENIKNALVELNPEASDIFEQNYETLKADLEELDHDFHSLVETKENPEMVVSHAAYGYWEESYGITQIPISGISSSDEPSQKDLIEIIDLATEKEIKYIVFEQNVTPKVAEVIREEIHAEAISLHNLSVLTDEDIENGEDYFSLMEKNLEVLDQVLR